MAGSLETNIIGVGVYRLSTDRPNTFVATWYSTNAAAPLLCSGLGHGDTTNGFCGAHQVRYYRPDGELSAGPFELTIEAKGEVRELLWCQDGKPCFKGIGIESGDQLIMSYWRVSA